MTSPYKLILIALLLVAMAGASLVGALLIPGLQGIALAQTPAPAGQPDDHPGVEDDVVPGSGETCQSCHESIDSGWQTSAHAQAASDRAFQQAWREQGSQPECLSCHTTAYDAGVAASATAGTGHAAAQQEGISCATCHSPAPENHPEEIMPIDGSSRFCGTCHIDTYADWEVSAHGQGDMACVNCHNPHTTELKKGNIQDLCQSCHRDEVHFFSFTAHAESGLLCTDCHLQVAEVPVGEGHAQRKHTFEVDLESCTQCHGDEMHDAIADDNLTQAGLSSAEGVIPPGEEHPPVGAPTRGALAEWTESVPRTPITYVAMALFGLAFGVALAPWVERWYRRRM